MLRILCVLTEFTVFSSEAGRTQTDFIHLTLGFAFAFALAFALALAAALALALAAALALAFALAFALRFTAFALAALAGVNLNAFPAVQARALTA